MTDAELDEFESVVIPQGIIPEALRNIAKIKEVASWVFQVAREGTPEFRSRFLEFWLGVGRTPVGGFAKVRPQPKLQIMVQRTKTGIARIRAWPKERLPEGHTCPNELY